MILIVVALLAIPFAALAFATGAGKALKEIGKGPFAIEQEFPAAGTGPMRPATRAEREAEIRQMLEARAYRAETRGDKPVDVDAELKKLLAADQAGGSSLGEDEDLRAEVKSLVVARNERRGRAGKKPLDVEKEIERQLRELENLGQ
ncbi:MAG: hypothetical protein QOD60_1883 [Solirubrobacterales bacterium]|nr:hypothetical protein [Solirubrobacterales bacterium]